MEAKDPLDRLYKRNAKRIELVDAQRKMKEEINVSNEQLNYFNEIFKEKSEIVEAALNRVEFVKENDLIVHFDNIKKDLHELQNIVANSSFFLKEFYIRKSQDVIQNLQSKCSKLQAMYLPKKKFGFRNKAVSKKSSAIDKAASDVVDSNVKSVKNSWDVITCGFSNKSDEKLSLEDASKKDVGLSHLRKCIVVIKGNPATLHIDNIFDSIIICGPVSTSVFLDNCRDCELVLACQQLRCHSSNNCNIYLHVTSKAIIEDCTDIRVAPYNLKYEGINDDFESSSLDVSKNNWNDLDDFNWLAAGVASPNWRIMDENLRTSDWTAYI